jgi:ABC-type phosphate transport system substrate-binding protein
MNMPLQRRFGSGPRAVLVGLGVLGCCLLSNLVLAGASSATVPAKGLNCVASDGKINGRGSTYQTVLQQALAEAYRDDFCGNTTKEPEDVAGNTMLAYNYPAAEAASATGSGAGIKAASCRTDAFSGSDTPYTEANLAELDGVPGKTGSCGILFTPPFQPNTPASWPDKESGKEDTQANVMSFPVGGSSVALPVNLTNAVCTAGTKVAPTSLSLTSKEVSRIFGGDAPKWNDSELVANNPLLANCEGAIVRIVRFDSSGTTNIFKSYLIRAQNERSGATCAVGKKWEAYYTTNTEWPGKQKPGEEGTCTVITTGGSSGNAALLKKLEETPNGIGYADLAQAAHAAGVTLANVQNAVGTSYQSPSVGEAANCTYSVLTLPGGSSEAYVGLDPEDNWANNNEEVNHNPNHGNATDLGTKYPICGLTWNLVYTGLSNTSGGPNPISRLTADQRRTLYSYFTFVLSSTAQDRLSSIDYAPLPTAWLGPLTEGFQTNF